ncbi:MAG: NAD(P)-binding domain-containing protein [Nitrospiraceae bacterium]|nr:NAD(P)-binding domain-containing protein [Nitrospiraceae bacterium]
MPVVDADYQSSVRGIYVIGDVTGLPLVKVAANQGAELIEKMRRSGAFKGAGNGRLDLVIVGAGPAGLSAAIEAQKAGLSYVVLERERPANTIRAFPKGKRVYAEPRFLKNASALPVEGDRVRDDFLAVVDDTIRDLNLDVRSGVEVERIVKSGDHQFAVETTAGESFEGRNVVVAVGRQGHPRLLDVPGAEPSDRVTYRFHTPDDYDGEDLLVVGGGNSAVETALMLCDRNRVSISYRRDAFFRLKTGNQQRLDEAVAEGRLEVLFESNVRAVREGEVVLDVQGEERVLHNDRVIVLIGTLPPIDFLLDAGLELDGIWTKKRVALSIVGLLVAYFVYFQAKHFVLRPEAADASHHYIPGFSWIFYILPDYFTNLYGMYYLLYFTLIAVFGLCWAIRYNHRVIWRRNLTAIFVQWTLWWGVPTFLAVGLGRNVWTPLLARSLNAWPLNMLAFRIDPLVGPGDPAWWRVVAFVGVVWAVVLTFIVLPVFTVLVGKHYCSHVCSCGALAETVGNSFRHRGPKGGWARSLERMGFVFIALASVATIADVLGYGLPLSLYNVWVGTLLSGVVAIGLYPFLGQRLWCRYWCPLAFWMNFWGRWSRFKISPEHGKCIDCNVCNQYCQMGIDIKSRALQGVPVTLKDTPCVACGECVARCPMEILHLGDPPPQKPYRDGTDAGPERTVTASIHHTLDFPRMNDKSIKNRKETG